MRFYLISSPQAARNFTFSSLELLGTILSNDCFKRANIFDSDYLPLEGSGDDDLKIGPNLIAIRYNEPINSFRYLQRRSASN